MADNAEMEEKMKGLMAQMPHPQVQDWTWLHEYLKKGDDSPEQVANFVKAGGRPNNLTAATLGNRDLKAKPCPLSLSILLEARADPNFVPDAQVGSPLLHLAAWHSTSKVVDLLLKHRADLEIGEFGVPTPPLNTALAAGNAQVALALLGHRANVQWKHEDGATVLHVATAWISSDDDRARRRLPPVGEEPIAVMTGLLENGADPTQREGFSGMTPLACFRGSMKSSPWLQDEKIGPAFRVTSERVHTLLLAAEDAMKKKASANNHLAAKRYSKALEEYAAGRRHLEKEGVRGHHMAVLWSNAAICCKKSGDIAGCRSAAAAGLEHSCSAAVRAKLENHLKEEEPIEEAAKSSNAGGPQVLDSAASERVAEPASKAPTKVANPESKVAAKQEDEAGKGDTNAGGSTVTATTGDTPAAATAAAAEKTETGEEGNRQVTQPPDDKGDATGGYAQEKKGGMSGICCHRRNNEKEASGNAQALFEPDGQVSVEQSPSQEKKPGNKKQGTQLKQGFLSGAKEFYGPKGSEQGKNHSDLVDAPIGSIPGMTVKVPFGKVRPVTIDQAAMMGQDEDDE